MLFYDYRIIKKLLLLVFAHPQFRMFHNSLARFFVLYYAEKFRIFRLFRVKKITTLRIIKKYHSFPQFSSLFF